MELLNMKTSDPLLYPHLDFLDFHAHKTGWGVRYPGQGIFTPPCIPDMPCDMLLRSIKKCSYSVELLHMKVFHLLVEPDLDFLRFPKHKTGWGVRYPGQGIFTPTLYS